MLTGCAQIVAPTGGPKDETPPQIDTLNSTRNYQTRFEKQTIVLAFDEWVELRDAFSQVIVSPPLEFRPEVVRKKKTIQFSFAEGEILRDSATYVINFGQAIRDLTEGNVAPVTFVFSTGDFIDSLSVNGRIVDAFTNEPVEDALFLLYENLADSVFRKERPFYFARTDEAGNFAVKNMKAGTFKATALVEQNLNYLYDNDGEQIAFLDEPIVVKGEAPPSLPKGEGDFAPMPDSISSDGLGVLLDSTLIDSFQIDSRVSDTLRAPQSPITSHQSPTLRLFQPQKSLFLLDDDSDKYGLVKFTFNREFDLGEAQITFDSVGQSVFLENEKDTLRLWYAAEKEVPWNVYLQRDTTVDTIEVKTGLRADFYAEDTLRAVGKVSKNLPVQKPGDPFQIQFNHPLVSFDTSLVRLYEDSVRLRVLPILNIDSANIRQFNINFPWKPDTIYNIEILPGGLTDIYGLSLPDTLRRSLMAGAAKDYSTLTLRVKNLRPDTAYVIRVLENNENEYRSFRVSDTSMFEVRVSLIPPGIYKVELIEDRDRNGKWTTGDYDLKRQPERVRRRTLEELRADWEVDAKVEWTDEMPTPNPAQSDPPKRKGQGNGAPNSTQPGGNGPGGRRGNR